MHEPEETAPHRGYAKGAARRAQILDQVLRMVAEQGVDASSLRSIADALGISHATLRHYFPSRDALLVAVYREHEVRRGVSGETRSSAVGDMRDSAVRNREVPGLVQLYTTLAGDAVQEGHPITREFVRDRFTRVRGEIADQVRADQAGGRVDPDVDPTDLASLAIALSDGLQVQWLLDPEAVDGERVLRLLERLVAPRARGGEDGPVDG
ncbi:TetR/AcrR family transcriptional regulator [Isoptericola sp. BMS4]|uniref:TetR/AcrR family transcriptional regulator n=1 Tax=Isoptericola sp. BMS4 TaxID=2527875 RepID=UPI001F0F25CF|nr:TetR/AcrR family transcriptional regulator [Isoptericola sp. BMS4]